LEFRDEQHDPCRWAPSSRDRRRHVQIHPRRGRPRRHRPPLDARSFGADRAGYVQLLDWAAALGGKLTFAIEGTGSYGAGLTFAVRLRDLGVIEVLRTDRRDRRLRDKSDTLDPEIAARAVPSGHVAAIWKTADGSVEMIRTVKVSSRWPTSTTTTPSRRPQIFDTGHPGRVRRREGVERRRDRGGPCQTSPAAASPKRCWHW